MEAEKTSSLLKKSSRKTSPFSPYRGTLFHKAESISQNRASSTIPLTLSPPPSSSEISSLDIQEKTLGRKVSPLSLPPSLIRAKTPTPVPTTSKSTAPPPFYPPTTAAHTNFKEILTHTAKCDKCNKHNKATLQRCTACGFQICTPCWLNRGGGQHTVTRVFKGPVFNPNAVDEENVNEGDDEEDGAEDTDDQMSHESDDVEDNDSDVMTVSENKNNDTMIKTDDSDDVFSIHSIDKHDGSPSALNCKNRCLDISHRAGQTGEAACPVYSYSNNIPDPGSEDCNDANELPAYQTDRARPIARRYPYSSLTNQDENDSRGDGVAMGISCQNARDMDKNRRYYSDLAPESRERIDVLISTAISLFEDAAFDPCQSRTTDPPSADNLHSPLFVPIGPDDQLTPAYNERLSHANSYPSSSLRISRRPPSGMLQGGEKAGGAKMTHPALPSQLTTSPRKRKRDLGDIERPESVWRGPFIDESTDEEGNWRDRGCSG
ncbi:conserved hypothetical protein [Histoplasma capsulatum var. duboisii H88]|uniref:Uncharacterized protein n=1 Tax=Ajellomyces capsulatus (strain H88) TaxID=544711 RepID=F0UTT1_AJEC8|nr:conserved hypothetical protein [Histoplasma capsulatum var. duboisii H88]